MLKQTTIRRLGPYHIDDESYLRGEGRQYVEEDMESDAYVAGFRFIRTDHATQQECDEYTTDDPSFVIEPEFTIMLVYEVDELI